MYRLREWGHEQAVEAGEFIRKYLEEREETKDAKLRVWHSHFERNKQSKDSFIQGLGPHVESIREDYFITGTELIGLWSDIPDEAEQKRLYPIEFEKWDTMRKNGKMAKQELFHRVAKVDCRWPIASA